MALSKEQFLEWRDNPATVEVLQALKNYSHYSHTLWITQAWAKTLLTTEEQLALNNLKTRCNLAEEWADISFEDYEEFSRDA